nr:MAG TPA: hypothetical protein [Caudoviricetes sp.]
MFCPEVIAREPKAPETVQASWVLCPGAWWLLLSTSAAAAARRRKRVLALDVLDAGVAGRSPPRSALT